MSTICKLDPNVRRARMRRRVATEEMRSFAHNYGGGNFRIESMADAMDQVRHDPRFAGWEKDMKFKSLLNRQQSNGYRGA